jgi:hypothetical protein
MDAKKMKRFLLFPALSVVLMAGMCDRQTSQITCPSSHEHPAEFWTQVAVEAEKIMDTSPAIMILLDENRVNEEAIRICIRALKNKGKKKS